MSDFQTKNIDDLIIEEDNIIEEESVSQTLTLPDGSTKVDNRNQPLAF
jgi:hypothetical protein